MLEATTKTIPGRPHRIPLIVAAWLALGATLGLSGAIEQVRQIAPAFVIGSAIAWSIAYAQRGSVREWADALPMRALVAFHAIRLPIGAVFLWEASRGRLPSMFADRAGWGDIAVGAAAIAVALYGWRHRRVVLAFAIVGLADILVAFGTGMYLVFVARDPLMDSAITTLPYPLLPMAIVPLVMVTHLLMIVRGGSSSATRRAAR